MAKMDVDHISIKVNDDGTFGISINLRGESKKSDFGEHEHLEMSAENDVEALKVVKKALKKMNPKKKDSIDLFLSA